MGNALYNVHWPRGCRAAPAVARMLDGWPPRNPHGHLTPSLPLLAPTIPLPGVPQPTWKRALDTKIPGAEVWAYTWPAYSWTKGTVSSLHHRLRMGGPRAPRPRRSPRRSTTPRWRSAPGPWRAGLWSRLVAEANRLATDEHAVAMRSGKPNGRWMLWQQPKSFSIV